MGFDFYKFLAKLNPCIETKEPVAITNKKQLDKFMNDKRS